MHAPVFGLSTFFLNLLATYAAEIDKDDIPVPCQQACFPIVAIAKQCSDDHSSWFGDSAELDCICNATTPVNVKAQLPECEACVRWQKTWFKNHGDVAELNHHCGFPRLQSFNQSTGTAPLLLVPLTSSTSASSTASLSTTVPGTTSATVAPSGMQSNGTKKAGVNGPVSRLAAVMLAAAAAGVI